jgi:hypothetical protein
MKKFFSPFHITGIKLRIAMRSIRVIYHTVKMNQPPRQGLIIKSNYIEALPPLLEKEGRIRNSDFQLNTKMPDP